MKIHALLPWPHHERHVMAVFKHLPDGLRGAVTTGLHARSVTFPRNDVVLVGGWDGIDRTPDHRIVYVEHGAGQSYVGTRFPEAYPGGPHPGRVIGYISPRQEVADAWGRQAVVAGCPALDEVKSFGRYGDTAAITFHWNARPTAPEARSAREHYQEHLHSIVAWLRDAGYNVIGSAHPRDRQAHKIWRYLRVSYEHDPDVVLTRASLLIADNTSLMYEAAALGIPVIALNAPWYRREVEHGLRFWSHVPGGQVDDAFELMEIDLQNYTVDDPWGLVRAAAAEYAYGGPLDRESGKRAAQWLTNLVAAL